LNAKVGAYTYLYNSYYSLTIMCCLLVELMREDLKAGEKKESEITFKEVTRLTQVVHLALWAR